MGSRGIRLADLPAHVRAKIEPAKKPARRPPAARSNPNDTLALHIRTSSVVPAPELEFRFHPTRKWRADFAWPAHHLLLEVEGGTWLPGGGRHNRGRGFEDDCEKYLAAFELGYRLLRFTTKMVNDLTALRALERFFSA